MNPDVIIPGSGGLRAGAGPGVRPVVDHDSGSHGDRPAYAAPPTRLPARLLAMREP